MVQKCLSENDFREGVRALLIEKVCGRKALILIEKSIVVIISNVHFYFACIFYLTLVLIQRTINPNGGLRGLKMFVPRILMITSRTSEIEN